MSAKKRLKITHEASKEVDCAQLVKATTDALLNINNAITVHSSEITHVPFMARYRCQLLIDKVDSVSWYQCKQAIRTVQPVTFNLI